MRIRFIFVTLIFLCMFALGGCSSNQVDKLEKENITLSDQIILLTGRIDKLTSENKKMTMELNDLRSKSSGEPQVLEKLNDTETQVNKVIEKIIEKEKERIRKVSISVDDQNQVEILIQDYFSYLENKDYSSAWELTSSEQKHTYPKENAINEHWGMESIHLTSIVRYLPPIIAKTVLDPDEIPTIWFEATLDIEPSSNSAWDNGLNKRFVSVVKESDGIWKINGLATSP